MEPVRILIADDHRFYREGVKILLRAMPQAEIVGEVTSGDAAVVEALRLQPDLILMDIKMPGLDGIEATRRIVAASPHIAILIVTMFDDDNSVFAAMRAGARGYLLKDADQDELIQAVTIVSRGGAIFSPAIARRMMHFFNTLRAHPIGTQFHVFPELTEREHEVLHLIAQGLNNAAIAERLGLSLKTVQNHVSNIFSKLQVADRAEAIVRAREAGLGRRES
jgi:DNA-binding NarL/FixJ family response regulator